MSTSTLTYTYLPTTTEPDPTQNPHLVVLSWRAIHHWFHHHPIFLLTGFSYQHCACESMSLV